MKKALLILDLQQSFMNEYTNDLKDKIEDYCNHTYYDHIIIGKFINQEDSVFIKRLSNTKCLDKIDNELNIHISKEQKIIERTAYTAYTEELENFLKDQQIKYIYLCGLNTETSIYKTALDLFEHGYYVYVIKSLSKSSEGTKYHDMAIELLKHLIGEDYVIE